MSSSNDHIDDALLDELDASVSMLGRLFSARHGEMCSEPSVTMSQALTMRVLAEQDGLKIGELAALMGIKAPAASSLVEAMERGGLISREHDPDDRRISRIHLTEQGREALTASERFRREHMRRYVSVLTREDVEDILRVHRKLIESLVSESS